MKKEIVATTFTPLYNPIEDRVCLAINYEDPYTRVDFMITRSFMLNLIPSAQEYLERHFSPESETPQAQMQQPNYEKATDNVNLELFQNTQELLLEVNFSLDQTQTNIELRLSSQETQARAVVSPLLFETIIKSLKKVIPAVQWGIGFDF